MAATQMKIKENPIQKQRRNFIISQILLRTMAGAATLAATVIMVTNRQTLSLFGLQLSAKYSYAPAFRYFVVANALACSYSVLSLPFCFLLDSSNSETRSHFIMFLTDTIMMGLMISGTSAATAISFVAKFGNPRIGWASVCDEFEKFCNQGAVSLISSYAACIVLFILVVTNKPKQTLSSF